MSTGIKIEWECVVEPGQTWKSPTSQTRIVLTVTKDVNAFDATVTFTRGESARASAMCVCGQQSLATRTRRECRRGLGRRDKGVGAMSSFSDELEALKQNGIAVALMSRANGREGLNPDSLDPKTREVFNRLRVHGQVVQVGETALSCWRATPRGRADFNLNGTLNKEPEK